MICLNCNSEKYEVVMSESFQCSHCDGYVFLEYCLCEECKSMWRAVDGEIDKKNFLTQDDMMGLLNPMGQFGTGILVDSEADIDGDFMKKIEEELMKHDKKEEATSMADLVHKCMKCNAVAHETGPGYYECSECEFTWEVVNFDK